jgi:O-Antigen ligase
MLSHNVSTVQQSGVAVISENAASLVVVIFLLALLLPTETSFYLGDFRLTVYRVVLIFCIVPYTLTLLSQNELRWRVVDSLVFFHCFWVLLALAINHGFSASIEKSSIYYIEAWGAYLIGRCCVTNINQFQKTFKFLVTLPIILLLFTLPESIFGAHLLKKMFSFLSRHSFMSGIDQRFGLTRAFGPFDHPILNGMFCAGLIGFSWFIPIVYSNKILASKKLRTFLIVLASATSVSAGAMACVSSQVIVILWEKFTRTFRSRWLTLMCLIALLYFTVDILSNRSGLKVFLSYLTFSKHTAYWRLMIWDWGMVNVADNPWFGLGFQDWVRPSWIASGSIDNFWLVTMVRYGLPAFFALAAGIFVLLFGLRRDNAVPASLKIAWGTSCIGLVIAASTVHLWNQTFVLFMFLLGAGGFLIEEE